MRKLTIGWLCLGALIALGDPAAAQQHPNVQRGFAPDKLYQFDIDQVNLLNGNLLLNLDLNGSFPLSSSLSYGITISYNSKAWDFESVTLSGQTYVQSMPNRRSNLSMGWLLTLGKLIPPTDPTNESTRWLYFGPDGSEHAFYPTLHDGETETPGTSFTRDGSYLRMREVPGLRYVDFPDGAVHTFDEDGNLVLVSDRYNNYLIL